MAWFMDFPQEIQWEARHSVCYCVKGQRIPISFCTSHPNLDISFCILFKISFFFCNIHLLFIPSDSTLIWETASFGSRRLILLSRFPWPSLWGWHHKLKGYIYTEQFKAPSQNSIIYVTSWCTSLYWSFLPPHGSHVCIGLQVNKISLETSLCKCPFFGSDCVCIYSWALLWNTLMKLGNFFFFFSKSCFKALLGGSRDVSLRPDYGSSILLHVLYSSLRFLMC